MKIALVTAHWPPRLSGHGDYAWHLASGLLQCGDALDVYVLGQEVAIPLPGAVVNTVAFPGSAVRLLRVARRVAGRRPDVVLMQFEANAFQLRALPHLLPLSLRRSGARVIVTYHELWAPNHLGQLAKLCLLNAPDRVIVFSDWHAAGVARFRRRPPRADVIACPTNFPTVLSDRALCRARFGIAADVTVIGFLGFILPEHRLDELLGALAVLRAQGRRVMLSVIGEFQSATNGYHQRLVDTAAELRVSELVTWHGRVREADAVARLLAICDVAVMPYHAGVGENNGAFAAFAQAGVPVVTTRGERSTHMEAEGVAVFSDAGGGELAGAISRVLDDPELAAGIATRARAWSQRRSWDRVVDGYRTVIAGSAAVHIG